MRSFTFITSLALLGCQQSDPDIIKQLEKIDARLARIEAKAPPVRRPRHRPPVDTKTVHPIAVEGAPSKGPKEAKVTIVKAFEFACPACERARPMVEQLLAHNDSVRIVYKNFLIHPQSATVPARAGCAAARQGKWPQMEAAIWDKGFKAGRKLGRDHMISLAREIGLNAKQFESDMAGVCKATVDSDHRELKRIGTNATPTFYINGRRAPRSVAGMRAMIDEELAKADKRIAQGTVPGDYYNKWVMKRSR